jgi:acyl carrier protein
MTLQKKLAALEEMMEMDEGVLSPETTLEEIDEWDSMSALSFVVLMKEEFNKTITGKLIRSFQTIQDMLDVMNDLPIN